MTRKPRISDVARRAKVSVGTVSHVLTGSANVSARRRERVEKAIEDLGYVPNFHAQGLRRSLSRVVGICFPHVSTAYLNELAQTLEEIASRDGYGVMHVLHVALGEQASERYQGDIARYKETVVRAKIPPVD